MTKHAPKDEVWEDLPGFADYQVSSFGRMYNKKHQRILDPNPNKKDGYVKVSVFKDGKRYMVEMGRAVCHAFHGPPPTKRHEADHLDGIRHNNKASNLRWATKKENIARRDLSNTARGEASGQSKLTEDLVKAIRKEYSYGSMTQSQIADKFNVTQSIVSQIVNKKVWRHL